MGQVREILQQKGDGVISISPTHTVYEALELMVAQNIGALPVLDKERLMGIFTERDYARKVVLKGRSSKETLVKEVMSDKPASISTSDSLEHCMKLMTDKFVKHLPVINNGSVIGIISIGDVVKFIMDEQQFIIENLEGFIVGHK